MAKPRSVADYLEALPGPTRDAFETLRAAARAGAPDADEVIAYDMPALRLDGRYVASYAAYKRHFSLFAWNDYVLAAVGEALRPYMAGKGTLRFAATHPIPIDLVRRVVEARVEEARARGPKT